MFPPTRIPPVVYMFWHDREHLPAFQRACVASIARHNPGLEIRLLGIEHVPDVYLKHTTPQQQSDYLRLYFIGRNGGIWLDVGCVCTAPLPFDLTANELQCYASFDGCIDTWAFAAPPGNATLLAWLDEYRDALKDPLDYCTRGAARFMLEPALRERLPYLMVYVASAFAQERTEWVEKRTAHAIDGPFYYIERRNPMRALMYESCPAALVKLTGPLVTRVMHAMCNGRFDANVGICRELLHDDSNNVLAEITKRHSGSIANE